MCGCSAPWTTGSASIDGAAKIEVPCRKATEALLAAHVCQLIANDHGEVHGGEGFYDEFYIRDGAYQVMELEEAGFADAAAKAMERYLVRQRDDGRFESQAGQFDANGQAVWTLWQYYRITGDREFLARVYPAMRRAVEWTRQARRTTPAPFTGVLPPAPADGESLWEGKHHIVGYDLWNLRGMLCTADAARRLGKPDEAQELLAEADGLPERHRRRVAEDGRAALPAELGGRRHALGQHGNALAHGVVRARRSARGRAVPVRPAEVRRRIHRGHDPVERRRERAGHPSLHGRLHDHDRSGARPARTGRRGFLLVLAPLHRRPRVSRRHLLQETHGVGRHDSARDRSLQLRDHAAPHAGP